MQNDFDTQGLRTHCRTKMNELRVNNWNELNNILFDGTWNPTISRYRSTFAYRGVSIESYPLTNGLTRLGTPYPNMEKKHHKAIQEICTTSYSRQGY